MADQRRHYPPPSPHQAAGRSGPRPSAYPGPTPSGPEQHAPVGSSQRRQSAPKPSAYWPLSIIAVLFGPYNLFVGIVAIVFSAQVGNKWTAGDVAGARTASSRALVWSLVGIGLGILVFLLFVVIAAGTSGTSGTTSGF